ncbi:MAG: hypothetical protein LUE17_00885 [Planctomycetaceae bacterium]|nr:hypothetical protein [Planctomycetaceae bacterium]
MLIRPMAAAYAMGEIGRSAAKLGAQGGPTSFLQPMRDEVALGTTPRNIAGLYSASPLFKIVGTVELMCTDGLHDDTSEPTSF